MALDATPRSASTGMAPTSAGLPPASASLAPTSTDRVAASTDLVTASTDLVTAAYAPPPPTVAPPLGWRPPHVVMTAPPRQLPEQDHAAIDAAEQSARTVTLTIGGATLLVLIMLFAVLCGQLLR